jgi:carbonic anhydrase/acetyltransferase-like protein (isoleucine patch superfamily)
VVPAGTVVSPGSLVLGIPAKVMRSLTADEIAHNRRDAELYVKFAQQYREAEG